MNATDKINKSEVKRQFKVACHTNDIVKIQELIKHLTRVEIAKGIEWASSRGHNVISEILARSNTE